MVKREEPRREVCGPEFKVEAVRAYEVSLGGVTLAAVDLDSMETTLRDWV